VWSCRPASEPLRYAFVDGLFLPDSRTRPPSYNVAPSQELSVIGHNHTDAIEPKFLPLGRRRRVGVGRRVCKWHLAELASGAVHVRLQANVGFCSYIAATSASDPKRILTKDVAAVGISEETPSQSGA
jgi:hypothetical protein